MFDLSKKISQLYLEIYWDKVLYFTLNHHFFKNKIMYKINNGKLYPKNQVFKNIKKITIAVCFFF